MVTVMGRTRNPGGGRKKLKPEYNAGKNLKEQMEAAVALSPSHRRCSESESDQGTEAAHHSRSV